MKLSILTDNTSGGQGFLAEHGLSYFIETKNGSLLFDTGSSDVFLHNAKLLGIDIAATEQVVLSHGHWDHGNGLQHISGKRLITHPDSFMKRYRKNDMSYIGLAQTKEELSAQFDLHTFADANEILSGTWFLGSVPRTNSFEAQTTAFADETKQPDFVPDDSGIAIVEDNKLIVITGCAHAGICNTIAHAKQTTGIDKVYAVLGGFHLKKQNSQTQQTIEYFKAEDIEHIYPSHCTELPALAAFYDAFGIRQLRTGMVIEL